MHAREEGGRAGCWPGLFLGHWPRSCGSQIQDPALAALRMQGLRASPGSQHRPRCPAWRVGSWAAGRVELQDVRPSGRSSLTVVPGRGFVCSAVSKQGEHTPVCFLCSNSLTYRHFDAVVEMGGYFPQGSHFCCIHYCPLLPWVRHSLSNLFYLRDSLQTNTFCVLKQSPCPSLPVEGKHDKYHGKRCSR